MRILHVIGSIDPRGGGPQAVVLRLAGAQASLGHRVAIATYGDAGIASRALATAVGAPGADAVELRLLGDADVFEQLTAMRGIRAISACIDDIDFVHIHGVWERLLPRAAAVATAAGAPYCVLPHGMLDPWSLKQKRLKKGLSMRLYQRRMLDGAAFIQVLNVDERRFIDELRIRAPLLVIGNGISPEEIDRWRKPGRFRSRIPEIGDRPFVLFLGRLHAKKGLDVLARAFEILAARRPDVHLVVAGPDDGYEKPFREAIMNAGLRDRVHVTGPLYGASKFEALADASCFCLPSRQEGFSIAITEALACGVPVAISEGCHFPEVAEAGAGRVLPLEPRAFAEAIDAILSDPKAAARMGEAGRALVAARFIWQKIAVQTVNAYASAGALPTSAAIDLDPASGLTPSPDGRLRPRMATQGLPE